MVLSLRTPSELRLSAARFREMALHGDDWIIQAALCQVANEFEWEADRVSNTNRNLVALAFPNQSGCEGLLANCSSFIRSSSSSDIPSASRA
jgi:hypothetical protein